MPKANETGDKPVKEVKAKSAKTGKAKPADATKTTKATKATKTAKATVEKVLAAKAVKRAAPKKKTVKAGSGDVPVLLPEQRRYYVEVAAYYIAERRGFCGSQLEDWVQAEDEIDRLLREGILKP